MARKIIDIHQHLAEESHLGPLTEVYAKVGVVKAVLLGMPSNRQEGNNEIVLAAARKYPELYIPFVGFDLDELAPDHLTRFRDEGFCGAKFIAPAKPYNDSDYMPVYEKACDLKLPVLFHLGIVANTANWADVNSNNMRPIHLDHIARQLPELAIIGAHLGNPWYDEATMACRWNPNLHFDLSGSTLKKKSPEFLAGLLWWRPESKPYRSPDGRSAWDKILFGSDVAPDLVEDVINDYENLMASLSFTAAEQDNIWCGNAARLLDISLEPNDD